MFLAVLIVDHLRRIRANETGRSLVELTGDGGIFRHLHRYFVFLLKAGGLRITECVLEGPPRVIYNHAIYIPTPENLYTMPVQFLGRYFIPLLFCLSLPSLIDKGSYGIQVVADPESSGEQPGPAPSTPEALERPLSAADFRVVEGRPLSSPLINRAHTWLLVLPYVGWVHSNRLTIVCTP